MPAAAETAQITSGILNQVGFVVHPKRCVVERFFAWTSRNRRLWRDPEATLEAAKAFLYAASIMLLACRLAQRP